MPTLKTLLSELTSGDEARAQAASSQFSEFGEQGIEALAELLESEDPDVRWWVTRTLATLKHPLIHEYLHRGLNDPDIAVQQCAALALREKPDSKNIPDLVTILGHRDQMLSRLAGDALIAIGKDATQTILEVMGNGDSASRVEAARVLAAIKDQRSIPMLFKLLDEESTIIRYWAEEGLNKMGVGMVFFKPD
jgi:HEAT repeat protein